MTTLLLLGTAWANLFGPNDHDDDGVPDKDDRCMHRKEVVNGYQDDDGCPDALSAVEIAVHLGGNYMRNAPLSYMVGETARTTNGKVQIRDLHPGTRVRAFARVGCMDGEVDLTMQERSRRVKLNLVPRTRDVTVLVRDLVTEQPGRARIQWSDLAGCGPEGPMRIHDQKLMTLGYGEHTVGLGRGGREPFTFTVGPDTDFVVVPASAGTSKRAQGKALEPVVYFATNRANIDASAEHAITTMQTWLNENPTDKVRVVGNADERGSDSFNLGLSDRRAERVRQALIDRGIAPDRLILVANGESNPAESGWSETALAKNRRVNFYKQ